MRHFCLEPILIAACLLLVSCGDEARGSATESASLAPDDDGAGAASAGTETGCEGTGCDGTRERPGVATPEAVGADGLARGESAAGAATAGAGGGSGADAATGGAVPSASVPSVSVALGPAPDLVLDAAYLLDSTVEDVVAIDDPCLVNEGCVTGLGDRRVVRFGSRTGNVGTAALSLGNRSVGNPYWTADTCQGGFDLLGFARYELFDAATGESVLTGAKNGFCIRDSEPWELEGDASCYAYNCSEQGISPGCADNYGSELECQWLDITNVPAGLYTLRAIINATFTIPELDYSNNVVDVNLQITDSEVIVQR
jgi:hypothetical protein